MSDARSLEVASRKVTALFEDLLAAERAKLVASFEDERAELARRMYRRGYLAGRASKNRGAPAHEQPELHARGELRALLGRAA